MRIFWFMRFPFISFPVRSKWGDFFDIIKNVEEFLVLWILCSTNLFVDHLCSMWSILFSVGLFFRIKFHWGIESVCRAIDKQLSNSIAQNYALLSVVNVALFRSSTAFLNNSFSMYTLLFAYTAWFSNVLPVKNNEIKLYLIDISSWIGSCVLHCIWITLWMDLCGCTRVRRFSNVWIDWVLFVD